MPVGGGVSRQLFGGEFVKGSRSRFGHCRSLRLGNFLFFFFGAAPSSSSSSPAGALLAPSLPTAQIPNLDGGCSDDGATRVRDDAKGAEMSQVPMQ